MSLIGKRFNGWTVLSEITNGRLVLFCECDCGVKRALDGYAVKKGLSKSCGCSRTTLSRQSRAYSSWENMKARCLNPNTPFYKYYGGRGITICESWLSFDNFFEDMGEAPKGLTLERIDSNKKYEPGNCRWATRKDQQNNRRSNRNISYKGETKSVTAWAEQLGINPNTLRNRLFRAGWSVELAFDPTLQQGKRN